MPDPNKFNTQVIAELRANQGKGAGRFEGAPMIILHTTGATERRRARQAPHVPGRRPELRRLRLLRRR